MTQQVNQAQVPAQETVKKARKQRSDKGQPRGKRTKKEA